MTLEQGTPPPNRHQKAFWVEVWRRIRGWPLAVVAILLIVGSLLIACVASSEGPTTSACELTAERGPLPAGKPVGPLKPESPAGMMIPFGRSRALHSEIFYLNLERGVIPDPKIDLNLRKRPLRRQEIYGTIFPEQYEAVARIKGGREVTVRVCIPDDVAHEIHPGTYSGGVVIADRRVEKTTVSITATFQYPEYCWVLVVFALVVLSAGSGFVWAASRRAAEKDVFAPGWFADGGRWARSNVIAIILGSIAATSAFIVSYWRNPAWGAKAPEDWLTLLGAMFSAFTAALAAASRAGESKKESAE
jgi:hypothetical protein